MMKTQHPNIIAATQFGRMVKLQDVCRFNADHKELYGTAVLEVDQIKLGRLFRDTTKLESGYHVALQEVHQRVDDLNERVQ